MQGPYAVDGAALRLGPLVTTERACADAEANARERAYYDALGSAATFALSGDRLTIEFDGGQLVFAPASR